MKSAHSFGVVLAAVALLVGCRMCQSPFDYCGPVIEPNGCPNCDFGARRGSLFHPMDGTPPTTPLGPTPVKAPTETPKEIPSEAPLEMPDELPTPSESTGSIE